MNHIRKRYNDSYIHGQKVRCQKRNLRFVDGERGSTMSDMNNKQHQYNSSAAEVDKALKKAKKRITAFTLSVIAVALVGVIVHNLGKKSNLDYIDGNVLKIARSGSASTGNVWKGDSFISQLTWETLFGTDATFTEVNPRLAENIVISPDGLTYTIVLKEGLLWSDGTPLTMDDVVYSIESVLLCSLAHNIHSIAMQQIKGVEEWQAVGAESWANGGTHSLEGLSVSGNVLTITMENAYSSFPMALTQFVIMPKHALNHIDPSTITDSPTEYAAFTQNPVCSGMYMVDCINSDGDLELIHNPNYHGTHSDIERVIMYGEYQTMYIDYYSTSTITDMVSYRNMAGFEEFYVDVLFYRYFVFNLMGGYEDLELVPALDDDGMEIIHEDGTVSMVAVYDDPDRSENYPMQNYLLRQAISLAIDRESIAQDVYLGNARHDFKRTGDEEYVEFLTEWNLTKAKELLIESEYDVTRPIVIKHYHKDANSLALLSRVQESLQSIGLTVDVVLSTGGNVEMYNEREYDILLKGYAAQNPTEWYVEYLTSTTNVQALVGTDIFDDLTIQLEGAINEDVYHKVWAEMQELDRNTMYRLPIVTTNDCAYINGNRISVPEDMVFGNVRYRSDLRFDEWYVKKG